MRNRALEWFRGLPIPAMLAIALLVYSLFGTVVTLAACWLFGLDVPHWCVILVP